MKLNQTAKRIICLVLSVLLVAGTATPAFASTNTTEEKNKVLAEIVASIDTNHKNAEEAVKIHLAQAATPAMVSAEELLATTDADVNEILGVIDVVVKDADARLTAGCANSDEALFVYNNVATLQTSAQQLNETAKADLATAQANLVAAQTAYDEAAALSAAEKDEIEAQLEIAKVAVSEAEAVLEITVNKLEAVEDVLAKAAADVDAWKAEAQNALDAAAAYLEESNAQLDAALAALATENGEFVAAVDTFKTQSEEFATSVKTLANKIEDAKTKDAALNALYAEYEAVLVAYETALADFSAVVGAECLTYEDAVDAKEELEKAKDAAAETVSKIEKEIATLKENIEKNGILKAGKEAERVFPAAELERVETLMAQTTEGAETERASATKALALWIIEEYLASADAEIVWCDATHNTEYGKTTGEGFEVGFFVVLVKDENGEKKVDNRYGFALEDGVVNIYEMKGTAPDIVTYNNEKYVLYEDPNGKYIDVDGVRKEVISKETTDGAKLHVVEKWVDEDVFYAYDHEVVDDEDAEPNSLKVQYEGIEIPFGSLEKDNGKYVAEFKLGGLITFVLASKNVSNEWEITIHDVDFDTCKRNHTTWTLFNPAKPIGHADACWLGQECDYSYKRDVKETLSSKYITVEYPDKTMISYNGESYKLLSDDKYEESFYIIVGEEKVDIVVSRDNDGKIVAYGYCKDEDRSEDRPVTDVERGGDADTVFTFGDKVNNSDKLHADKQAVVVAIDAEINKLKELIEKDTQSVETKELELELAILERDLAIAKYDQAIKTFEELALDAKYASFKEKDLGVLAVLPKNIEEFVNLSNIESLEDITALVNAIAVINNKDAGVEEKINAYGVVASYIPGLDAIIPDITSVDFWWSVATGKFWDTELGKLFTPGSYQYNYFMAWLDAFVSKVKVIESGIKVVDEARKTITAGLNIIYAGAELSDVAIQTMIEKIKNEALSGTVAALMITVDMVEVSDEMVNALYAQVSDLRTKVSVAEAQLETAKARLAELEYQNPGQADLDAAKASLEAANANYNALVAKLANVEAYIAQAEGYKATAQAQYNELLAFETPAAPGEGPEELPTPEVDSPAEEGEGPVVPPTPGVEYVAYTVKFVSEGVVLSEQTVEAGTAAVAPETAPTKAADENYTYTFAGWDVDFSNVTSDLVVTAQFNAEGILPGEGEGTVELPTPALTHTVTYVINGEEVVVEVAEGEEPVAPEVEEEIVVDGVAYRFVRWAERYVEETGATVLEAVYEEVTPVEPEVPSEPETPVAPTPAPVAPEQTTTTTPVIYYAPAPVVEEVVEAEVEEVVEEVVENVVTNNEITIQDEVVEIVDEETPLADGVTEIVEEEVPLAANKEEENEVAPVVTAVAGTATVAAAGGVGFVFFRKRKFF